MEPHPHPPHGTHGNQDNHDVDWTDLAAPIEREGEVLLPIVAEALSRVADQGRRDGLTVERIVDIGSGPGVGSCALAQRFAAAQVLAVDASEAMLDRAEARAAGLGLTDRVRTLRVDLPAGLAEIGSADVVWASMVLHHIGDERELLRGVHRQLVAGGLLAIAEFGDPERCLPDDLGFGRPGLGERLAAAGTDWVATMRADLPDATPSADYLTMLTEAGFEVVGDRLATVHLDAPLDDAARRVVLSRLRRTRVQFGDRLDAQDQETIDRLCDEDDPGGVLRRSDLFLEASQRVIIARAVVREVR